MIALLKTLWLQLLGIGVFILSLILALLQVRKSGKDAVRYENLKKTVEAVKEREKIKYDIKGMSASERNKLRKRWQRD